LPAIAMKGGEWVAISDGPGSGGRRTGSSWYLLRFEQDGTAQIIWPEQGHYARECVAFSQKGSVVTMSGAAAIPQLNDTPFRLNGNSMATLISRTDYNHELTFVNRSISWPYIHFDFFCLVLIAAFFVWLQSKWVELFFIIGGIFIILKYGVFEPSITMAFMWFEIYLIFISLLLFWLARFTELRKSKVLHFLILAALAVNMLGAVNVDFHSGILPNILNGLAGIMCVLSMFRSNNIGIMHGSLSDITSRIRSLWWICAYGVWNVVFMYLNYNSFTSHSIAINAVLIILAALVPGSWLLARTFTLGFLYIYLLTFGQFALHQSFIPIPISGSLALSVSVASFGLNLTLCAFVWCWRGKPPGSLRAFDRA
jgi:hypothetical protein